MSAFEPRDLATLGWALALLAGTLLAGFGITCLASPRQGRFLAWSVVIAATAVMERLCADQPAGFRMMALILVLLYALKAVVAVESQADGEPPLRFLPWLGFAALWIGMRPEVFARRAGKPLSDAGHLALRGFGWLLLGVVCFAVARLIVVNAPKTWPPRDVLILATLFLLPGLSMILHFGIINIMTGFWRWAGFDCGPIMRTPLASASLTEFWGRRWNLAFTELTTIGIVRPLRLWIGETAATCAAFLASGVLHEMAISVPVQAGFGLPLLYFILQGGLVLAERRLRNVWPGLARRGWLGHVWTLAWLALPLPILFHPWFLSGVVWPLIGLSD